MISVGVAVVVAVLTAGWKFARERFPRTGGFLCRSPNFALYLAIHGFCAGILTSPILLLRPSAALRPVMLGAFADLLVAVVVGACSRLLAERFSLTVLLGGKKVRCGLKPLLEIADGREESIRWDEFNAVRRYLAHHAASMTVELVRALALENIAPGLPDADVSKFRSDIAGTANVIEAFECYLRFAGKRSFDRVFAGVAAAPTAAPRTA